ncbi:hypothetical protein C8R42DRAFT_729250 [Lentinula raphanica]|nr:hypothetical protein C8R42DRAFT_729250 [Lentinula raphanica]
MNQNLGDVITSNVLLEVCYELRAPSLRDNIVPVVARLQKLLQFTFPTLFSKEIRKYYLIENMINIASVERTDHYFDLFLYRQPINVPRNEYLWKEVLQFTSSDNTSSFSSFNRRHLYSASKRGSEEAVDPIIDDGEPLSDEEDEKSITQEILSVKPSPLPTFPSMFVGEILCTDSPKWGVLHIIKTRFALQKIRNPFTSTNEKSRTEQHRKLASEGERPSTLEEFAVKLSERYTNQGSIVPNQKWLHLTQTVINGREIQLLDANNVTIASIDSTLPENQCSHLWNAIMALCHATGAKLRERNTSVEEVLPPFQVWHLSFWGRFSSEGQKFPTDIHPRHMKRIDGSKINYSQFLVYPSNDLQEFPAETAALSSSIGPVIHRIIEKRLARNPDLFGEEIKASVNVMPLHDTSMVSPFMDLLSTSTFSQTLIKIKETWGVVSL